MRALALGLAVASGLTSAVCAKDYETVIDLPKGAVIEVTVERSRIDVRDGQRTGDGVVGTFKYRQVLTPTETGYQVVQTSAGQSWSGLSGEALAAVEKSSAKTPDMTFQTGDDLAPKRIEGWPTLAASLIDTIAKSMGPEATSERGVAAIQGMRGMYSAMTPEQAAGSLLREQAMSAEAQNAQLDLRKPTTAEGEFPNPMGGPPVKGVYAIELVSVDRTANRAVIEVSETLDPESVSAATRAWMTSFLEKMPKDSPRPKPGELEAIKLDRTRKCRSDMDIATGLAVRTECAVTISAVDANLKSAVRTDRWVISQKASLP